MILILNFLFIFPDADKVLPDREIKYNELDDLIEQVQKHAESLTMKAEDLTNQHSNITANSEDALTGKIF